MPSPSLPVDLTNGKVTRTANTPSDYWDLRYQGYTEVDGPATASLTHDELTPAQKAARTRAANKAKEDGEHAVDTSSEAVDTDLGNQAGDANPDA